MLGTILLSAIVLVLSVGLGGLTALAGFVYPAYKSFQAIETKNKGDDTQWLVYWVIFAFFSIVETFVGASLFFPSLLIYSFAINRQKQKNFVFAHLLSKSQSIFFCFAQTMSFT